MRIGVLALQGAFREHARALAELGAEGREVRRADDLASIDGLVIPGGESTTIGMLLDEYGLTERLRASELPIFGTCAGMILLAREIEGSEQPRLGLMDIAVRRNHFGRQRESFEADLDVEGLTEPLPAVFIRAPIVDRVGPAVRVLARYNGDVVLCEEGRCLAAAFHPELTPDRRIHRYFLERFVSGKRAPARTS